MGRKQTKSKYSTEPEITLRYDGEWPNLCSGHLVVTVDGTDWDFGKHVLHSGGSVTFDDKWSETVTKGDWDIMEDRFPEAFPREWRQLVVDEVNRSIPHGCCGGCV